MDFVSDQLLNNRRIRGLTIMDVFSRYCHGVELATSITGSAWSCLLDFNQFLCTELQNVANLIIRHASYQHALSSIPLALLYAKLDAELLALAHALLLRPVKAKFHRRH